LGFISFLRERQLVDAWVEQLEIIGSQSGTVMELSGGNQQKVVLARGLARQPSLLVLDDPFRGVDVMTKRSCYARLRAEADRGMTIVWYSTENAEFSYCDRVYVLRAGEVNGVLDGDAISEEAIVRLSFVTGGGGLNGSTTQAVA
jgi:ribose transport system ATP-binding protein